MDSDFDIDGKDQTIIATTEIENALHTINPSFLTIDPSPLLPTINQPLDVSFGEPLSSPPFRPTDLPLPIPINRKRSRSAAFAVVIPPRFPPLPYSSSRTGIVYDERMRFHVDSDPTEDHPEQPRRILEIFTELNEAGLVAKPGSRDSQSEFQLLPIPIRAATDEEILMVHSREHLDFVQNLAGKSTLECRLQSRSLKFARQE